MLLHVLNRIRNMLTKKPPIGRQVPLIIILGSTGSGKTKLSLELAQKFEGEIIGADSMQIYKGLDIVTAKATADEMKRAPHHLISILEPHKDGFTVVHYRDKALSVIDDIISRNKLPIIVGGTNYYIESLLWNILIEKPSGVDKEMFDPTRGPNNEHLLPTEELHKQLQQLDPVMARRLHPNNKRKILRALEVLHQKGRRLSEILTEQQGMSGASALGGPLRYSNSIIFWLQCDQEVLDERLNKRVDAMVEEGLINELLDFHKTYNEKRLQFNEVPDYTRGIFQSIGFKEFHEFLTLSPDEKKSESGKVLFDTGLENLKMVTRRYARKQKKWVSHRLLSNSGRQVPPVYGLDTTDLAQWEANVKNRAFAITEAIMGDLTTEFKPLSKKDSTCNPNSQDDTFNCESCGRVFVGDHQWKQHVKSKKHRRVLDKQKVSVVN